MHTDFSDDGDEIPFEKVENVKLAPGTDKAVKPEKPKATPVASSKDDESDEDDSDDDDDSDEDDTDDGSDVEVSPYKTGNYQAPFSNLLILRVSK